MKKSLPCLENTSVLVIFPFFSLNLHHLLFHLSSYFTPWVCPSNSFLSHFVCSILPIYTPSSLKLDSMSPFSLYFSFLIASVSILNALQPLQLPVLICALSFFLSFLLSFFLWWEIRFHASPAI